MKKLTLALYLTFMVVLSFLFFSVSGFKKFKSANVVAHGMMADVAGSGFWSNYVFAAYSKSNHFIVLSGYQLRLHDTISIELDIPDTVRVGQSYSLRGGAGLYYENTIARKSYSGDVYEGAGSVTIHALDTVTHIIRGSFNGTLAGNEDSVVVTHGYFNTGYLEAP